MKKSLYIYFIFYCIQIYSQSPEKFTYQSIVRGSDGAVLTSAVIGFRLTILQDSSTGSAVYSETHTGDTNQNGLVTLIIGDGTSSDNFSSIDWSTGQYFLKVEVDPLGGSNYLIEDTSQLLSVPYALYSGNSLKLTGNDYITLNNQELTIGQVDLVDDVDGILPVINGGTGSNTALMVGVITANDPASARAVLGLGTVATTASGDYATAAQGVTADAALPAANVSIFGSTLIDDADAATARTTLGLGTAAATDVLTFGIDDTNSLKVDQTGGAADDDFAKFTADGIEGRSATELKTDLGLVIGSNVLAQQTIGIADNNLLEVDDGDAADDDFAKFTADGIEGRSAAELKSDLDLETGTDIQAFDAQLADVSALAVTDGNIIVGDGSNFVVESGPTALNSLGIYFGTATLSGSSITVDSVPGLKATSRIFTTLTGNSTNAIYISNINTSDSEFTLTVTGGQTYSGTVNWIVIIN